MFVTVVQNLYIFHSNVEIMLDLATVMINWADSKEIKNMQCYCISETSNN